MATRKADIRLALVKDLAGEQLEIDEFLGSGSDGLVYKAHYRTASKLPLAVKFYVPVQQDSLFAGTTKLPSFAQDLKQRHNTELQHLQTLSHPHLQKYVAAGVLIYDKHYFTDHQVVIAIGAEVPFIVSKYVAAHTLGKQLTGVSLSRTQIILGLLQVSRALEYLHSADVIHGDVRAENILLEDASSTNAVLIDFGIAKRLRLGDHDRTRYFGHINVPQPIRDLLIRYADDNQQLARDVLRRIFFPGLDLYFFGLLIDRILTSSAGDVLSEFDRSYLLLLHAELQHWHVVPGARLELPLAAMTGHIKSADELVLALDKLLVGPAYFDRRLHEDERGDPKLIQRWSGTVEVRPSVAPFLAHPSIRRLHNLNQLALIHYVYPSAGQTRFDHVLGVLGATQRMWRRLAHSPTFLAHFKVEDIVKLELLALLHDVNHFPFLHYFQEAGISSVRDISVLRGFLSVPSGAGRAESGKQPTGKTLLELLKPYGISEDMIRQVLSDGTPADWSVAMQVIKSIVNSGADVDKMAYVVDDAAFTGVPFGRGVDLEGLIGGAEIAEVETPLGKRWHLVFDKDALAAVESLCFARYWNFTRIYWHHTNRAIEAMIIYTIRELFAAGKDTVADFLLHTRDVGEAGALEHLALTYEKQMFHKAPIAGLWSDRGVIYRRVWEMPMAENEALLARLQDERGGLEIRRAANERVEKVIRAFIKDEREAAALSDLPGQVILDVPLRNMDLGGAIYIRESSNSIRPIDKVSSTIRELSLGFGRMSKTLRVYVAPDIRDSLPRDRWADPSFMTKLTTAIVGEQQQGEMR